MSRRNGSRMSSLEREQKKSQALELAKMDPTPTQTAIADEIGLSRQWVNEAISKLRVQWRSANLEKFTELQQKQLQVFEEMETLLLTRKIEPAVANTWWKIRAEISKLLGLDTIRPSVSVSVTAESRPVWHLADNELLAAVFDGLTEDEQDRVIAFANELKENRAAIEGEATVTEESHEQ